VLRGGIDQSAPFYKRGEKVNRRRPMRMMGLKTTIPMLILGVVGWTQATVITAENFNSSMPTDNWTFLDNGAVLTNNGPESVITATAGGKSLNVDITTGGVPQARNNISGISGADSG